MIPQLLEMGRASLAAQGKPVNPSSSSSSSTSGDTVRKLADLEQQRERQAQHKAQLDRLQQTAQLRDMLAAQGRSRSLSRLFSSTDLGGDAAAAGSAVSVTDGTTRASAAGAPAAIGLATASDSIALSSSSHTASAPIAQDSILMSTSPPTGDALATSPQLSPDSHSHMLEAADPAPLMLIKVDDLPPLNAVLTSQPTGADIISQQAGAPSLTGIGSIRTLTSSTTASDTSSLNSSTVAGALTGTSAGDHSAPSATRDSPMSADAGVLAVASMIAGMSSLSSPPALAAGRSAAVVSDAVLGSPRRDRGRSVRFSVNHEAVSLMCTCSIARTAFLQSGLSCGWSANARCDLSNRTGR